MIYTHTDMEHNALMQTAANMCAVARTAPKTRGKDNIVTLVLTGEEKDALAERMLFVSEREYGGAPNFIRRDAGNLRAAQAVVLVGVPPACAGLSFCSYCGFENCAACAEHGGHCAFMTIDLGIAAEAAAAAAAHGCVDTRIMFSVGKTAAEMNYEGMDNVIWLGLPLSISGKSPFFDRG